MSSIFSLAANGTGDRVKDSSWRSQLSFKLAVATINLGCCLGIPALLTPKAIGAEKIYLDYGPLEFNLSVESLEVYAEQGRIRNDFDTFANYLQPEQLDRLRTALNTQADLSPLAIAQFLYSYQGEKSSKELVKLLKLPQVNLVFTPYVRH